MRLSSAILLTTPMNGQSSFGHHKYTSTNVTEFPKTPPYYMYIVKIINPNTTNIAE